MAGFLGNKPSESVMDSSNVADGSITANDLNSTLDLSSKTVTLPASSVTSHVTSFDDSDIRSDILHLAIAQSLNDNRIAFSLEDSFVDTFEDSSGIDAGGNLTNVARDTTGEYVSSIYTAVVAFSNDSNTKLLLHMDDTGLTDSSSGSHAATLAGNTARSSTQSKFGSYSVALDGTGDYLTYGSGGHSDFAFGTGDFTLELWYYPTNASKNNSMIFGQWGGDTSGGGDGYRWGLHSQDGGLGLRMHMQSGDGSIISSMLTVDAWTHIAVVRSGTGSNNMKMYKNGVQVDNWTNATSLTSSGKVWMSGAATGGQEAQGFIDEARISNVARYSGTFTPNEVTSTNATGTLISDPQTASTSRTSCSGVIIYEDAAGTNTLGTDLKIYFSCNNSAWTEASSYGTPQTYSGNKKLVKLGATTCSVSGTAIAMKAVWANQSSGAQSQIAQGTGTAIGNAVSNGGLSSAFDANTNQAGSSSATISAGSGNDTIYVGKDWGSGVTKTISGFKVYSTNNDGISSSGASGSSGCSLTLFGSNSNDISSATNLGGLTSLSFRTNSTTYTKISGLTTTTAYRYHWVKGVSNGHSGSLYFAEVEFYETSTAKEARLHGWAVNY